MLSFYSKGASYNKILNHFIVERNIKCYFQEGFAITSDAFPLELWESEEGYCTLLVENRRKLLVVESFVVLKINMIIYHYYWVLKGFREKINLVEWDTAKHALIMSYALVYKHLTIWVPS